MSAVIVVTFALLLGLCVIGGIVETVEAMRETWRGER